ncbi:unnamed protein product [Ceutorhynchus assimilis]|uniref:Uncharacterized protein n=1 Tax=Ceutorhynchus assimilis TaxID=467358 RepID=A0A9N9MEA9_9CUCU|nr:unnamed protein product [Ceutorhynchus assimilis]
MRENIANPTPMESLSFNGFQKPLHQVSKEGNPMASISISSNVYYGYQPIRIQNNAEISETMDTEESNKFCIRMDTLPHPVNRKRTREPTEASQELWKKRRQNEPVNVPNTAKCLPIHLSQLDEDLLRETHGCSHYHWESSRNM